jgi:hypothetical protein
MGQFLSVLGPGRLLLRRPGLPGQTIVLPDGAWRETAVALRAEADGLVCLLFALRDGRFRLELELGELAPRAHLELGLPEAWVLADSPSRTWVRRKATEAAVLLGDEADAHRRRVRELSAELALIAVIAGRRPPGLGRAA